MRRTWLRRIGLAAAVILAVLVGIVAWQGVAPRYWALRLMLVRAGMWDWNWEWTLPGTRLSLRLESNDYWCIRCYRWIQRASIADQLLLAEDLLGDQRTKLLQLATCLLEDAPLRSHPSPAIDAALLRLAGGTDWVANCAWPCIYRRSPENRPRLRELLLNLQLPVNSLQYRLPVLDPNDGQDLVALLALADRSDNAVRRRVLWRIGDKATPELLGTDIIQSLFRAEYQDSFRSVHPPAHGAVDKLFMPTAISLRWLRLERSELVALVEGDGPYVRSALEALIGDSEAKRKASIPSLVRDPTLPIFCRWQVALAAADPHPLADDLAALAEATLALPDKQRRPLLARLRALMESGEWSFSMRVPGMMIDPGTTPPALLDTLGAETCARLGLPAPSTTAATTAP